MIELYRWLCRRWYSFTLMSAAVLLAYDTLPIAAANAGTLLTLPRLVGRGNATLIEQHNGRWTNYLYSGALALRPDLATAKRGLARLLTADGRLEEAQAAYASLASERDLIAMLGQARLLVKLRRPGEALEQYRDSGLLDEARARRREELATWHHEPAETEIAAAYLELARQEIQKNRWDLAASAGEEAFWWTSSPSARSDAAAAVAAAEVANGRTTEALRALWRSVSARPGSNSDTRYAMLARLIIRQVLSDGRLDALPWQQFAYVLRCRQWLGEHEAVVAAGQQWLRASSDVARQPAGVSVVRCLVEESLSTRTLRKPNSDVRPCLPASGDIRDAASVRSVGLTILYPVKDRLPDGRFLVAVAVNRVDLELGLPVAAYFYWSSVGTSVDHVTFLREANRAPNAGFEYDRVLGGPEHDAIPLGYERDIYHAGPGTRALGVWDAVDGQVVLELRNQALGTAGASGLASFAFCVNPSMVYVQGGRVRAAHAGLYLGRAWITNPRRETYGYTATLDQCDWKLVGGLVTPPSEAEAASIWALNYHAEGTAAFDDLIFLPIPPERSEQWTTIHR